MFSFDGSFDYSSIDELDFRRVTNHPTSDAYFSNGWDTRPVLPPSQKNISKEVSTYIHSDPSSSPKRRSNLSFDSSPFSSKDQSFADASFQEDPHRTESFDRKTYEAHILKVASETTIIDSMIFEDHCKLDLSSIRSRSQDDSIHFQILQTT